MLKCNLKDLDVISDIEARYAGFRGQTDFYLYILSKANTLEIANAIIHHYREFAGMDMAVTSQPDCFIARSIGGVYKDTAKKCMQIHRNLRDIFEFYPDFFEFMDSIRNAPPQNNIKIVERFKEERAAQKKMNDENGFLNESYLITQAIVWALSKIPESEQSYEKFLDLCFYTPQKSKYNATIDCNKSEKKVHNKRVFNLKFWKNRKQNLKTDK